MNLPRIIIAGPYSGVGKTTISVGLMGALKRRGLKVQAFKVGPDYIDPSHHSMMLNRPSRNLDAWMVHPDGITEIFLRATQDVDIAVIEGVMGLFDGFDESNENGSTAHIAKLLRSPVILVINVHGMAKSVAPIALGYEKYDPDVRLSGFILNEVGGKKHIDWCKKAINSVTSLPVLGALPRNKDIEMQERHLGLIPQREKAYPESFRNMLINFIEENVDVDRIIDIARSAENLPKLSNIVYPKHSYKKNLAIGVALDESFNFYYQDNLDMLRAYGADIMFFNTIKNSEIPSDVSGLYIGGGFPEMLPERLGANTSMLKSIRKVAEDEMPIYAECGGLMYLTDFITDFENRSHKMVGLLNARTVMTRRLTLNYTLADVIADNPLSRVNDVLRGHEFHYSKILEIPRDVKFAYRMKIGIGIGGKQDAWLEHKVLASYMHMHFAYQPKLVKNFLRACEDYSHS
ncbi:MAG: hydrogenobyrinic acid a,c-diamide synthase (glutamine-hydrolyzing) [archaeon]|nr:hydrogenobyrinic acid a,c-diamide synthase (glutamine-hydrolyzing) [archaeon]MCP8321111.1 hydrogenobyrinic acid a,c-diamide synthase (glutamine-hydrolyzing) [archaeon]